MVDAMSDGSPAPRQWQLMTAANLPAVNELAARIHPDFPERPEILAEKFHLFPRGCFVLSQPGAQICGYCFSHPWMAGPPPALDTRLHTLPQQPDIYFLHDLALDAPARGRNLAASLVPDLVAVARSIPVRRMALVAVGGSGPFWTRMGFQPIPDEAMQAAARAKYGGGAVQMERDLT